MTEEEEKVAEAKAMLRRVRHILSVGGSYDRDEWLLLATLVVEAELLLREARHKIPRLHAPLFDEVMAEFRAATADFTDPGFLRGSRAARRHNPALFDTNG